MRGRVQAILLDNGFRRFNRSLQCHHLLVALSLPGNRRFGPKILVALADALGCWPMEKLFAGLINENISTSQIFHVNGAGNILHERGELGFTFA